MKAIWIDRHGGPEVLAVREASDPIPGPGEVRVQVHACGLNFAEISARQGIYPDAPKPPCIVGYQGAGIVDVAGPRATRWKPGDRVVFLSRFGAHASAVCVQERQVFAMPDGMTFEEGAALPVNYLTAYHALFEIRRLRAGDSVLVHMAAGGVGTAVLQLCRTVEGVMTIGTASARKHDHLRLQGCRHAIDPRSADYATEVRRITGGRGVDVVLDALGGPDWMMRPDREPPPDGESGGQLRNTVGRTKFRTHSTEIAVEALVFSEAARTWIDHMLVGDIEIGEGVDAASVLIGRAQQFAAVA
jgi:NADPH:quinone reductase-like Zn-dependent oxidoreductase